MLQRLIQGIKIPTPETGKTWLTTNHSLQFYVYYKKPNSHMATGLMGHSVLNRSLLRLRRRWEDNTEWSLRK
jgi:hypothetical protein